MLLLLSQVFETTGKNKESVAVAGLAVSSGKLSRTHFFRVVRDEEVLADRLKAASMRHHKDRVNEVAKDKVSDHRHRPLVRVQRASALTSTAWLSRLLKSVLITPCGRA